MSGLAGVTLASLLSACGGGGGASPTAAPAKPADSKPADTAAKPAESKPADASKPGDKPAQAGPGGFGGGGSLSILARSHFVPAYDTWLDKFAKDWGAKNKVEMSVDHLLAGELPAKWAAEVAASAGHDMTGFTLSGGVNLYNQKLVDLNDLGKSIGDKHGGWIDPLAGQVGQFEGAWKGIPDYFTELSSLYRKDLYDANGFKPPETWDELLKQGTVLKGKGNPIGVAINQKSNDANNTWNAVLWCYGASYVAKDGKTPALKSPETVEAVKFAVELYKNAMTDEVLSWDDTGNNQLLASGRGSWIHNPISALRTIEKDKPDLANNIWVALPPGGPKERVTGGSTNVWAVWSWSKNVPAAKAFLEEYYANFIDAVKASEGYNQPFLKDFRKKPMAVLGDDPKLQVLQDFDKLSRASGYPGPPTPAAAEVEANWIIPLMIGRAVQGGSPEDAVDWGAQQVERIYAKYK